MQKRYFRLIAAGLLLAMALTLAGCAGREDPYADVPDPVATITMADGKVMRARLFPREAPNTVGNFIELANGGFYDGLPFHRVVTGYLIQTGDPAGDGTGGPGYTIRGEFSKNGFGNGVQHARGTLSMARLNDYNSAGSQFFIVQRTIPDYDGLYAAFGRLMDEESLATLDAIAAVATDANRSPLVAQNIRSIRVDTQGFVFPVVKIEPKDDEKESN